MRRLIACILVFAGFTLSAAAQDPLPRAKILKLDVPGSKVTLAVPVIVVRENQPRSVEFVPTELIVVQDTRFRGSDGSPLKEGLRHPQFKEGIEVEFEPFSVEGKDYLFSLRVAGPAKGAQPKDQPIQPGKIKKIDAKNKTLTITAEGKDLDLIVRDDTRFMDADGQFVQDGLSDPKFKQGTQVMFKAVTKDGKNFLIGMRIPGMKGAANNEPIKVDTTGMKPLTELGQEKYHGFQGGLYPDGKNERPAAHEKAGLALARSVQPLDAAGKPDANGKIVLISVGMSNATQVFSTFIRLADKDGDRNPKLIIVDCAVGGQTAGRIQNPEGDGRKYWSEVDFRLKQADVTREQVQAVWIKEADPGPT